MEDFSSYNLWMFLLAGVFAFLLCFLRYQFLRFILPVQILIYILFFYKISGEQSDINLSHPGSQAVGLILLSMLFFIGMSVGGAALGFKTQTNRTVDGGH